jgi:hypothetical protein
MQAAISTLIQIKFWPATLICTMSVLGHKRTLRRDHMMSALLPKADIGFDHTRVRIFQARNRQLAIPSRGWLFIISAAPLPSTPAGETSILSLPIESGCHGQPTNPSLKAVSTPAKRLCNWLKNHAACPPKADIRMQMRPHRFYFPPMTIAQ